MPALCPALPPSLPLLLPLLLPLPPPPLPFASGICACSTASASPHRCVPCLMLLPALCLSRSPLLLLLSLQMSRLPLPFLSSFSHAILTPQSSLLLRRARTPPSSSFAHSGASSPCCPILLNGLRGSLLCLPSASRGQRRRFGAQRKTIGGLPTCEWRAYCHYKNRQHCFYLGMTEHVTIARLEQMAATITARLAIL